MDFVAHFVVGLWLSIKIGNPIAIPLSVSFDIDHVIGFLYDKRKKMLTSIPNIFHFAYRPRSWLHSISGLMILFVIAVGINATGLVNFNSPVPYDIILFCLILHLLIDMLDKDGIHILPPITRKEIRGALPVGYLIEDPKYLTNHKRSHVPSLILIAVILMFIFFGF
jgi:membrane-bound metal-dependent hydrolase YbcI (DUF457 family)